MRFTVKGLLSILALFLAAQPAQAICSCGRYITADYSYVITPGCEATDCGTPQTSVTDDLIGYFWTLGQGDPELGNASTTARSRRSAAGSTPIRVIRR